MFLKQLLLALFGFSFGMLSSAGVFTALSAVSLVPRFAGRLRLAKYVFTIENAVVLGGITFGVLSVYADTLGEWSSRYYHFLIRENETILIKGFTILSQFALIWFGLFTGIFVGCLAFAIAEMLDSIPIFARRIQLKNGLPMVVLFAAIGKLVGSLFYFLYGIS